MKKERQTPATRNTRPSGKNAAAAANPGTGAAAPPMERASAKTAPAKKEAAGAEKFEPRIIAFVCKWCSDAHETEGSKGPATGRPAVRFVSVMCSGRVQPSLVLKAFELGADGVMVCGCGPGKCHYYFGNEKQAEMFETSKKLVSLLGLEAERLRLEWIPGADAGALGALLDEFTQQVRRAGPSPLRK
jgi:F420-non-reducing hydrogenase iron-sulfur subunit